MIPEPVLKAFDLQPPYEIGRLGGTASRKWSVNCIMGRFVLRIRPEEFADAGSTRFDHEVMLRLSAAHFPVPRPRRTPDGRTWITSDAGVYECLSWIEGDASSADLHALGSFVARFHAALGKDAQLGKDGKLREDHPDLMEPFLASLRGRATNNGQRLGLERIANEILTVRANLDEKLFSILPRAVIHGDLHPGNMRFRGGEVAALYDFDYLSRQARVRDLSDCLMFFASRREQPLQADDIRSLTQPFVPEVARCRMVLDGYQKVSRLTDEEWRALPWLMRSRWIQIRLRGCRKVAETDKLPFVLERFFDVIEWLERDGPDFFRKLRS